ncbi:MAG: hypothetical protein HOV68_17860, partial [Streptomycetaceae bacterium]|nr:hypothetical protein [Streptomycetaceae bacterium]
TGLTAPGAFVVAFGLTMAGMLFDELATDKLGVLFGTVFIGTCVLVAVKTRVRDLVAAAVAPPLAFALTILLHSLLFPTDNLESFMVRTALDMFQGLAYKAAVLWGGSLLAIAIVLIRFRADREATRRRTAREPRPARDTASSPDRPMRPAPRER